MFSDLTDKLTLLFFSLTSGRLKKRLLKEQYVLNLKAWDELMESRGPGVMDRQQLLSSLSYGRSLPFLEKLFLSGRKLSAAENSCEVIAVWHAARALGYELPFPALLRHFSESGICAGGLFGTSPSAVARFFKARGFKTHCLTGSEISEAALDELDKTENLCIMSSFNKGQDPFSMVHTMCLAKSKKGWVRHNDNGAPTAPSLKEAVLGYKAYLSHPIRLTFISVPHNAASSSHTYPHRHS